MNPAKCIFSGLEVPAIEKVVKIALDLQYMLGAGDELAAAELFDGAQLETEEKIALWSCFNSQQRSLLKDLMQDLRCP